MMEFLRPYKNPGLLMLAGIGAWVAMAPPGAPAQATEITQLIAEPSPLLLKASSQGYLGIWVDDVDKDKADTLKLKEVRGAVITLIDHDAPAGQIPLKVNDVVVELNGQPVEGAEQLKRMLHEIPPGRKVSLVISRDGNLQTVSAQLADHKKMVEGFWTRIGSGGDIFGTGPGMTMLPGGDTATPQGFHLPIFGSTLNVGALVEPLTSQMADYLGVPNGLMVKQVARKTEADAAGLKAFDVILKVGADSITTVSDWERALHANQGKPVSLTVLRDKKQQLLTLQVDSKHNRGELELESPFDEGDCPLVAALDSDQVEAFAGDAAAAAKQLRDQLEAGGLGQLDQFKVDPQQAEELRKEAEKLRESMQNFKIDPETMDELKQQMQDWQRSFNPDDFKVDPKQMDELKQQLQDWQNHPNAFTIDPKQMEELKRQMEDWQKKFDPEDFKFDQKQLDELKRQIEQMQAPSFGYHV